MVEKKKMKKIKGVPVFHVLKRVNEYKEEDLKKAVENANKQIEFSSKSIPIFAKHPKRGEQVPVLDYVKKFELDECEILAPDKDKNMKVKKLPTVYADVDEKLMNRIKSREFPNRSIGFSWRRETKDSEPVPVITHIAMLKEGQLPGINFPDLKTEEFDFDEEGLETFEGIFNEDNKKENEKGEKGGEPDKSKGEGEKGGGDGKDGEITIGYLFEFIKQNQSDMMEILKGMAGIPPKVEKAPEVDPNQDQNTKDINNQQVGGGGGNNLAMPLENFEAMINEENFEAKLVTDTHKTSLSRDKLISTYKAFAEGDVDKMIAELIDIAPNENFSANVNDSPDFNGIIYESDEDFEAGVTNRDAAWKTPDSSGKSPQEIYAGSYPHLSDKERYKKYFKIK